MRKLETEILTIGGGPAGSTSALYLSKLGLDTTLVEKRIFPRETLCGEFLSKEVTEILKELNIFDDFITLNPNKLKSFSVIDNSGIVINSNLNFDAYAMKRSVFDFFLLEKAKANKVRVMQPADVINVRKTKSGFISEIVDESGQQIQIGSKLMVAAYGKQNILDKKLHRKFVKKKSNLNGVKFHLPVSLMRESFPQEIRIYTNDGLYCGMNQVSDSEITICFLEHRKQFKIPARERLIYTIKQNNYLKKILNDEAIDFLKSANIYGAGNIFFGKKELVKNGIIMVGDAARVISPLAGDGIGMAMESAKILYEILSEHTLGENNHDKLYLSYKRKFEKDFNQRIKIAKIIQGVILNKIYRKIGTRIIYKYPSVLRLLINFTRSTI